MVPVSELCDVADEAFLIVAVVTVAVGAVRSILTGSAVADVCVSVAPSKVIVEVDRNLYVPSMSEAAVHVQAPVVA
jgi:hypothetical protein